MSLSSLKCAAIVLCDCSIAGVSSWETMDKASRVVMIQLVGDLDLSLLPGGHLGFSQFFRRMDAIYTAWNIQITSKRNNSATGRPTSAICLFDGALSKAE